MSVLESCSEEREGEGEVHAFHPRSAEMTPLSVPLAYGKASSINVQQTLKLQMEGAGQVPDANYCDLSLSLSGLQISFKFLQDQSFS